MPKKPKRKGKHIVARSIALKDAKGKMRILMDAGSGDGFASICLFGEGGRSIQISSSPEGGLYISLFGKRCTVAATLAMRPDECAGLSIGDQKGRLGTRIGSLLESGAHRLVVFHNGQPYWGTPEPPRKRRGRPAKKRVE